MCVCVCVCVCERERERERGGGGVGEELGGACRELSDFLNEPSFSTDDYNIQPSLIPSLAAC